MKRHSALIGSAVAVLALSSAAPPIASAAVATTASSSATPSDGLVSELLVRSAAGEFRLVDRDNRFFLGAGEPTDIALVRATIAPGGRTGFHTHPGRSMVLVQKGVMTTKEVKHRKCVTATVPAGQAFEHPEGVHDFINNGPDELIFYVTYFVPAGAAPLLIDAPAPSACG